MGAYWIVSNRGIQVMNLKINYDSPTIFFMDLAKALMDRYGDRIKLYLKDTHFFNIKLGRGMGTNT